MGYLGAMKQAATVIVILGAFLFSGPVEPKSDRIKPVSEWKDTFEINCSCGNYMSAYPCDTEHYKFVCNNCGAVYEKDWNVWAR